MDKVKILMKSYIPNEEGPMDFLTMGLLEYDENNITMEYEEGEITGLGKTTSKIEILNNNEVIIIREGEFNSKLHFNRDEKTYTIYNTPHGDITMEVVTNKLEVTHKFKSSGEILVNLQYDVYINGQLNGETKVILKVNK